MADLTVSLLARTEELRTLDNRRAELVTELELSRAHERELKNSLDEQKRLLDEERAKSSQELRNLRELLEQRGGAAESNRPTSRRTSRPSGQTAAGCRPGQP